MDFSTIPTRSNGEQITYSWFNLLRDAGAALEGGQDNLFTMADGQASFVDVTGLAFEKTVFSAFEVFVSIRRRNDSEGRREVGRLFGWYELETDTWDVTFDVLGRTGTATAVEFQIVAGTGQLQYKNGTAMAGTNGAHSITWSVIKTMGIEP